MSLPFSSTMAAEDDEKRESAAKSMEVLIEAVKKHPEIVFASTKITPSGEGYQIAGDLTLHGHTKPIAFEAKPEGGRLVAEITLHQPDFGIKPYSAMLGTLKIKPDLVVRCSLPR